VQVHPVLMLIGFIILGSEGIVQVLFYLLDDFFHHLALLNICDQTVAFVCSHNGLQNMAMES
jgi:hypothetical protein